MNILKALGIMAVVGGHCGVDFLSWFPVASFHMPLFAFISGYFFHDRTFFSFLKSKAKHLLCPLLLWNLLFGIVCTVFLHYGWIHFGIPLSFASLFVKPFSLGNHFVFTSPLWFVATLLEVQFLCWGAYRLCKRNLFLLTGIAFLCYGVAWMMADHGWYQIYGSWTLVIERALFLFLFYVLGLLYRRFGEGKDSFSVYRIAGLVILNGILLGFVNHYILVNVFRMLLPSPIWVPFVVSLSGIYLYMQAAELLKDRVKRGSLLGFIGEHTFAIMALHQFFFWVLNTGFLFLKQYGVFPLHSFNYDKYMHSVYFRVTEHMPIINGIYFLAGLGGSLLCVYLYERCKPTMQKWLCRIKIG